MLLVLLYSNHDSDDSKRKSKEDSLERVGRPSTRFHASSLAEQAATHAPRSLRPANIVASCGWATCFLTEYSDMALSDRNVENT